MTVAMVGLIVSSIVNITLLPKPKKGRPLRILAMAFQWALVPFIATILGAAPAVDAQTRLMLGAYMEKKGFWVSEKLRSGRNR